MGYEEKHQPQNYGRIRITTDAREINLYNIISVLGESYNLHQQNRERIKYLIEYERGNQPLKRKKTIREDINVEIVDNLASEIVEFKTSYKWSNPITYKQRASFDISQRDAKKDNEAIAAINEMLNEENAFAADTELAYYVETCGIGYQMVDIKRDVKGLSVFDIVTLNPLNTFIVRDNTVHRRPLMGVTYTTNDRGETYFTCITDEAVYIIRNFYEIVDGKKEDKYVFEERSGEANPFGVVNIVEFERSVDRMGCFERQISDMDNVNILVSDFVNNVAQDTQALWWGDNLDLPEEKDDDGNVIGYQIPRSGGWILTASGEQKKASVEPLVIQTQYEGILNNIKYRRDVIKQKCCVPIQASAGGGSTGTAMSMSSGWDTAEVQAQKESALMVRGKMEIASLILIAAKESTSTPEDSEVLNLKISDIQPNIMRDRNYDMATKANTLAVLMNSGVAPEHAFAVVKLFSDVNLVVNDSKPYIELYYKAKEAAIARTQAGEKTAGDVSVDEDGNVKQEKTGLQDASMQASNSPITGGLETSTGGNHGAGVKKA